MSAIGIEVSGISLDEKKVTLKGMNNLKGGVKINTFDLPSNDPAGGIHLTLDTSVTNVSYMSRSFPLIVLTTVSRSRRKSVSSCRRSRSRTSSRTSTSVPCHRHKRSASRLSRLSISLLPVASSPKARRLVSLLCPRCSAPSSMVRIATLRFTVTALVQQT